MRCATLAGATAALSFGVALTWPASDMARALARVLPLVEVHAQNAEAALMASGSDQATARALRESDQELQIAPGRVQPLLQRSFILARAGHGRLTPEAISVYARSYALSPDDYSVGPWREHFAYNHWQDLTTDLRIRAMREHVWVWNKRQSDYAAMGSDIHNSAGGLAYILTQQEALKDWRANHDKEH